MLSKLSQRIDKAERRLRKMGRDRSSWWGRIAAYANYFLVDHAVLRVFWTNFYQVAPGVYRSNQPTHRRFRCYHDMGVVSVLNLRGEENFPHFHFAKESCETLGMDLHIAKLWARNAPKKARIQDVLTELRAMPRPLLFHCKSGADRAGFVAAMYLLVFEGASVAEARKMLSLRFVHLKWTKTGVQDYILDVFEARQSLGEIGFEAWLNDEYGGARLQEGWDSKTTPLETAKRLFELRQEKLSRGISAQDDPDPRRREIAREK